MKEKWYKFYTHTRKDGAKEIIAVSTYAGRRVKGKAVCAPEDEFNTTVGEELAKLRCAVKIDLKRAKRAEAEKEYLLSLRDELNKLIAKNDRYVEDSIDTLMRDEARLNDLLDELS